MFKFKQMRERLYFNFLPVPFCIFAYFLTAVVAFLVYKIFPQHMSFFWGFRPPPATPPVPPTPLVFF